MSDPLATAALDLARRGWPVLPLHHPVAGGCSCRRPDCASPAKHPRTRRGLHDATCELEQVRRWWTTWPQANVGVRTGARPDGAGVVVLDIDPAHGGEVSLAELVSRHGHLAATLEVATGGGGRHLCGSPTLAHVSPTAPDDSAPASTSEVTADRSWCRRLCIPAAAATDGTTGRWRTCPRGCSGGSSPRRSRR